VNGAGAHGCMGSMNEGCNDFNGDVVGVIHEMFVVDGSDWFTLNSEGSGGAHDVFCGAGKREIKIAAEESHVGGGCRWIDGVTRWAGDVG